MSQLVGKSAAERNAASVMLDILSCTKNKTAAEVVVEVVADAPKISGQKVLHAVEFHSSVSTQWTEREDVRREWVNKVSKLPQGSLSSQANTLDVHVSPNLLFSLSSSSPLLLSSSPLRMTAMKTPLFGLCGSMRVDTAVRFCF